MAASFSRMRPNGFFPVALAVAVCSSPGFISPGTTSDWPQLQRDAARTGRTSDTVAPPFRARWVWLGPNQTLRNQASVPGWPDNLAATEGYTYPSLPTNTSFTISDGVQSVLVGGRLFIGSMEGAAYAIRADDGATVWTNSIPGGTTTSAAVAGSVVVFNTSPGYVVALRTNDGSLAWSFDTGKAITAAPCVVGNTVLAATHGGHVFALDSGNGAQLWRSPRLPAPIHGGLASDGTNVFVGAENMVFYSLNLSNGAVRVSHSVRGQSFRMLWPVVFSNRVWVSTVTTPIIGSEYVGESNSGSQLFVDGTSFTNEEDNLLRWLSGDTNGGRWPEAGADWKHLFALNIADFTEPFTIPAGPSDGVGVPAHPVVVDSSGRVLTYFKTAFPKFTRANGNVFGTQYSQDIAAINPVTGRRMPIDNGHLANIWPWETDNLYGMVVAGNQLWLRQNFRGTMVVDLTTSIARGVSAPIRHNDGGNFVWDVVYRDQPPAIDTPQAPLLGRIAPIVVGNHVYQTENWAVTCIEHKP
jgi:outer membrane protein assembly factor BamB